jgi:sugar phosphate isomerase/epimerase
MKYSFMSFSTPSLDLAAILQTAQRYGYDGIEPRLDADHAHGIEVKTTAEQRKSIRAQVKKSGIQLSCLATSLTFADPTKTDEMIRQAHERIDLAGDLAVPSVRIFGGAIPKEQSREKAVERVAGSLRSVADHAQKRGVTLCFETHDDWCDPANVAAVLKRVDHPAIAANWDIMHPVRTGLATIDKSFEILKPWIRHLHVHDGVGGRDLKLVPIGTGDIDHRRAIELLIGIRFDGFISGEWIGWEPFDVHLPRELVVMKRYEQELS